MKRSHLLTGLLILSMIISACFPTPKGPTPFNAASIGQAKTALVIRTDYVYPKDVSWENRFLAQKAGPGDRMALKTQYLDPLYTAKGEKLFQDLGSLTAAAFTGTGMPAIGLDTGRIYYSHDFPVSNVDFMFKSSLPAHNYKSLADQGFTHALIVGFNNSIQPNEKQRMLYFGVMGVLVDIQGITGGESREQLNARTAWSYWINQTPSTQSTNFTTVNPMYRPGSGDAYLLDWTQTWQERVCLNVICHRRDGAPYSMDELFAGSKPLYIEAYKKAAAYNLAALTDNMKTGVAGVVQNRITLDTLLGR